MTRSTTLSRLLYVLFGASLIATQACNTGPGTPDLASLGGYNELVQVSASPFADYPYKGFLPSNFDSVVVRGTGDEFADPGDTVLVRVSAITIDGDTETGSINDFFEAGDFDLPTEVYFIRAAMPIQNGTVTEKTAQGDADDGVDTSSVLVTYAGGNRVKEVSPDDNTGTDYTYNAANQLTGIYRFDDTGQRFGDSTRYFYQNGRLVRAEGYNTFEDGQLDLDDIFTATYTYTATGEFESASIVQDSIDQTQMITATYSGGEIAQLSVDVVNSDPDEPFSFSYTIERLDDGSDPLIAQYIQRYAGSNDEVISTYYLNGLINTRDAAQVPASIVMANPAIAGTPFTVQGVESLSDASYNIIDATGRTVTTAPLRGQYTQHLPSLPAGQYVIAVEAAGYRPFTKQVVVTE